MEFNELVKARRSIRSFMTKNVEEDKLMKVLNAVNRAPSAGNLQAYHIHLVKTPEIKEQLQIACADQEFITQAPFVLIFSADKATASSKYEERGEDLYSIQDATIAATYAVLAAADVGLGSVWVGAFDPLEVSRLINLDSEMVPVAVIPIGYPAEDPAETKRKSVLKMVTEV